MVLDYFRSEFCHSMSFKLLTAAYSDDEVCYTYVQHDGEPRLRIGGFCRHVVVT